MANLVEDTLAGYFCSQLQGRYKNYKQAVRQDTLAVTNITMAKLDTRTKADHAEEGYTHVVAILREDTLNIPENHIIKVYFANNKKILLGMGFIIAIILLRQHC